MIDGLKPLLKLINLFKKEFKENEIEDILDEVYENEKYFFRFIDDDLFIIGKFSELNKYENVTLCAKVFCYSNINDKYLLYDNFKLNEFMGVFNETKDKILRR